MDSSGTRYKPLYENSEEVDALLQQIPVTVLAIQTNPDPPRLNHHLLRRIVALYPGRWRLLGAYPRRAPDQPQLLLYEQVGSLDKPRTRIRLDFRSRIGYRLDR